MNDQLRLLVDGLLEKSLVGQISWEEHPRKGVFQTSFGFYGLTIEKNITYEPNPPYEDETHDTVIIRISNSDDQVIESFSDEDLSDKGSFFKKMNELYSLARRKALGADQAINDILERLGAR
jgi:hypothetical protein